MTESVKMKAPAHYLRVDLDDPGEAEYWQVVLDASRRQLETAIAAVGRDALDVRAWLGEGERLRATGARSTERPAMDGRAGSSSFE